MYYRKDRMNQQTYWTVQHYTNKDLYGIITNDTTIHRPKDTDEHYYWIAFNNKQNIYWIVLYQRPRMIKYKTFLKRKQRSKKFFKYKREKKTWRTTHKMYDRSYQLPISEMGIKQAAINQSNRVDRTYYVY